MKILVITNLFPNKQEPTKGVSYEEETIYNITDFTKLQEAEIKLSQGSVKALITI